MATKEQNVAWVIPSASKLTQSAFPTPTPGPSQALVRITAVSLNFRDHLVFHHSAAYPLQTAPNLIPCSDGAGTVVAAGASSKWRNHIGASVIVNANTWMDGDVGDGYVFDAVMGGGEANGTLARYLALDDERILEGPKGLSDAEAAGMVTAGLTAFNALFEAPGGVGKPAKGVTVLTQGTGGVSCFAIQLASAAGATVIATSSTDEKLEVAKKLGATHADLIPAILFGAKTIRGVLGAGSKAMNERFVRFVEEHQIRPVVAVEYEFEQAAEAFARLEKQSEIGKIVIRV
ncbi:hypothetical protein SLS55_008673 [Diplodia seriata]|uniref:Enoyl reductase (ER) domain-containing protein n=1 Tax=Diplodia seriata TaxID=420778 RepID=A0ABR3C6P2_9PEZI